MKKNEEICGIYKITCKNNGQFYIGSSKDIYYRWLHHISDLRLNKHHSTYLQRCYNKYGEDSILFEIVHVMNNYDEELLRMLEYYYIEELHPTFNSGTPCPLEISQEMRNKISETTKKLYTEKGYVNPRKGTGKKYNIYDVRGTLIYSSVSMDDISKLLDSSYHTFNTMLRKYNGICCSSKYNYLIMEEQKTFEDVVDLYKTTSFNIQCPICDLEGNLYPKGNAYYKKSRPHKGKGITFRDIFKRIKSSETLYAIIDNKIFTLPYLCPFIQKCILKTPEYPRNLSIERCMAT